MDLLFETLLIDNGKICNIEYHKKRIYRSQKALLGLDESLDIELYIKDIPKIGTFRCKVIYLDRVYSVEIKPYSYIPKRKFLIVDIEFDYSYKYLDRSNINYYLNLYPEYDEIIFTKDNLITDTTVANIAIYKDNRWLTPKKPLLRGTTRDRLIYSGKLIEADITYSDIINAKSFAVMNALSGFRVVDNPTFRLLKS